MSRAQLAPILKELKRQRDFWRFDRGKLGRQLMDAATDCIEDDMDAQQAPDGAPWAPLSEAYVEFKDQVAPGEPMAVLYGHMKTREQLEGQRFRGADEMRQTYGIDERAKQEASWFIEGNDRQPARPFYGFSQEALVRMDQLCDQRFRGLF